MDSQKLVFRYFVYKNDDGKYTGVCLDLDIVEEGHPTIQAAVLSIFDAVKSHTAAAKKLGFPPELIYRPAPKEYWEKLDELTQRTKKPQDISPFQYFTASPEGHPSVYA